MHVFYIYVYRKAISRCGMVRKTIFLGYTSRHPFQTTLPDKFLMIETLQSTIPKINFLSLPRFTLP